MAPGRGRSTTSSNRLRANPRPRSPGTTPNQPRSAPPLAGRSQVSSLIMFRTSTRREEGSCSLPGPSWVASLGTWGQRRSSLAKRPTRAPTAAPASNVRSRTCGTPKAGAEDPNIAATQATGKSGSRNVILYPAIRRTDSRTLGTSSTGEVNKAHVAPITTPKAMKRLIRHIPLIPFFTNGLTGWRLSGAGWRPPKFWADGCSARPPRSHSD